MEEKYTLRIGAAAGVIGALVFIAGNLLHARSADIDDYAEQIKAVAASGIWITDHLLLLVGGIVIGVFLIALHRTMTDGWAGALSRLGYFGTVASTAVLTVLIGVDGIASKAVNNAWAAAPASEKAVALRIAVALEEVDVGIFSLWIILFFGLTFVVFGLAIAISSSFPKWLGWIAVVLGLIALVYGFYQSYIGLTVVGLTFIFSITASLLTIWVLIMAVLLGRKTM